tara:strand:+ start:2171 stop:2656 length:486 start_codon:yes stop_codon:yes gene_type:complete
LTSTKIKNETILIHKNIEHHIERHFEINSQLTDFLQYENCGQEFFSKRLDLVIPVGDTSVFEDLILDHYGLDEVIDDYDYLHSSTFLSFFQRHNVDVPVCFIKTKSVKNPKNELLFLKFTHFLMRDGQKLKNSRLVEKSTTSLLQVLKRGHLAEVGSTFLT